MAWGTVIAVSKAKRGFYNFKCEVYREDGRRSERLFRVYSYETVSRKNRRRN